MTGAHPLAQPVLRALGRRAGAGDSAAARRATSPSGAAGVAGVLFGGGVLLAAASGWFFRGSIPLTPKSGPGYILGLCGGGTTLALALFPVRKRLRGMRRWGVLAHWFRVHMILGALAPLLILFHCNFRLGAPNSNVALISMLVVAASGVVGRFIHTHINHGLYGARATIEELHAQWDVRAHALDERLSPGSRAAQRLAMFAAWARAPRRTLAGRLLRLATLPVVARWVHFRVRRDLRADLARQASDEGCGGRGTSVTADATHTMIASYMAALVKEVQFGAYARLFSLWHALHVPLFIMLLLTGVLHVIAVHMY